MTTNHHPRRPSITPPVPAYTRAPAIAVDRSPPAKRRRPGAVRPNAGLDALYRRKIERMVDEMAASVEYWVAAAYRKNTPEMAELAMDLRNPTNKDAAPHKPLRGNGSIPDLLAADEMPADALLRAVKNLAKRWLKRFEATAPKLAAWFAQSAQQRSDAALARILRQGGFSVRWKMTKAATDVMKATIGEQVGLIKSIPSQYFTQVEGMVMRSVAAGRDLAPLARDLRKQYGVTKRRAALIARDQSNKATATITRVRQLELGLNKAIWLHSAGGKEPRPTHIANSGKVYDVSKGWYDPAIKKYIWPGTEINCRCVSKPVVPGFS